MDTYEPKATKKAVNSDTTAAMEATEIEATVMEITLPTESDTANVDRNATDEAIVTTSDVAIQATDGGFDSEFVVTEIDLNLSKGAEAGGDVIISSGTIVKAHKPKSNSRLGRRKKEEILKDAAKCIDDLNLRSLGFTNEEMMEIARKLHKKYNKVSKEMCETQGVTNAQTSVKVGDDKKEFSMRMYLVDLVNMTSDGITLTPSKYLN